MLAAADIADHEAAAVAELLELAFGIFFARMIDMLPISEGLGLPAMLRIAFQPDIFRPHSESVFIDRMRPTLHTRPDPLRG